MIKPQEEDNEMENRLFVRVIDKSKPVIIDDSGRRMAFTKWVEVAEVNLGSIKNPNRSILEFRFRPSKLEKEEPKAIDLNEFFRRMNGDSK